MNVDGDVRWAPGTVNSRPRPYRLRTKTGRLRGNMRGTPMGEVYRDDQSGFCYYLRGMAMGCYKTLQELMDAFDLELEEHHMGGTRSKMRKHKKKRTRRTRK